MGQIPDDIAAFVRDTALDDIVEALVDRYAPSLILASLATEVERYAKGCALSPAQARGFDAVVARITQAAYRVELCQAEAGIAPIEEEANA